MTRAGEGRDRLSPPPARMRDRVTTVPSAAIVIEVHARGGETDDLRRKVDAARAYGALDTKLKPFRRLPAPLLGRAIYGKLVVVHLTRSSSWIDAADPTWRGDGPGRSQGKRKR